MDSGQLLSTCAGSGVTLVAIIAGFMLTKYLSIASEIAAASNLADDLDHRLGIELADLRSATQAEEIHALEWDLDSVERAAIFLVAARDPQRSGLTPHELVKKVKSADDFSTEVLAHVVDKWNREAAVVVADQVFADMAVAADHPSWSKVRRTVVTNMEIPILWEAYYDMRRDQLRAEFQRRERARFKRENPGISSTLAMAMRAAEGGRQYGALAGSVAVPFARGRWAEAAAPYVRRREAAEAALAATRAEYAVAVERRKRVAQPSGAVSAIGWLLAVFVLTVLPSLFLLTPQPAHLTRMEASCVLAVYLLGVAVMFMYFLSVARGLQPKGDRAPVQMWRRDN